VALAVRLTAAGWWSYDRTTGGAAPTKCDDVELTLEKDAPGHLTKLPTTTGYKLTLKQ